MTIWNKTSFKCRSDTWDITLVKYFLTPLSLLLCLHPSSLSVTFTGPIRTKLGWNVNWMVLYILFPDRKFTNEKEAPKWTKTVFSPFVYMGFLLLHWFWWVFFMFLINFCLFCSFTLCPRENVTPVVIMVDVDVDVLHQNLLFFYTLCLNCSVYFMNLSFILFYDFFFYLPNNV